MSIWGVIYDFLWACFYRTQPPPPPLPRRPRRLSMENLPCCQARYPSFFGGFFDLLRRGGGGGGDGGRVPPLALETTCWKSSLGGALFRLKPPFSMKRAPASSRGLAWRLETDSPLPSPPRFLETMRFRSSAHRASWRLAFDSLGEPPRFVFFIWACLARVSLCCCLLQIAESSLLPGGGG